MTHSIVITSNLPYYIECVDNCAVFALPLRIAVDIGPGVTKPSWIILQSCLVIFVGSNMVLQKQQCGKTSGFTKIGIGIK